MMMIIDRNNSKNWSIGSIVFEKKMTDIIETENSGYGPRPLSLVGVMLFR